LTLAVILAAAACREDRPADPTTTVARPLTVGTTELSLAPATAPDGNEITSTPKVACNAGGRCLEVWAQTIGPADSSVSLGAQYVYARRIDQNGLVDAQVIVLKALAPYAGRNPRIAVAARDAGDFLVAMYNPNVFSLVRVDAATGGVLDNNAVIPEGGGVERILVVNDTYVVIYRATDATTNLPVYRAARVQGGVVIDKPGIPLGPAPFPNTGVLPIVGFGAGPGQQIVLVRADGLVRVDLATRTILDATPIAFSRWAVGDGQDDIGVAFDGANYILVWEFGLLTYAIRVRASDGAILDPHDDANQITGGHLIGTATGNSPDLLSATFDGTNVIVFAVSDVGGAPSLVATRVSPSATRVQGAPESTAYESSIRSAGSLSDVAYRAAFGITTWTSGTSGVVGFSLTGAAGAIPAASPSTSLLSFSYPGTPHDIAAVASNGRDFLLVYRIATVGAREVPPSSTFYAAVVDGQTGAVVGSPEVIGGNIAYPWEEISAIWTGHVYLVAWIDGECPGCGSPKGFSLSALDCNGKRIRPAPIELPSGPASRIGMACNPDRCALTYMGVGGIQVQRLDPLDGTVLDATPRAIEEAVQSYPETIVAGPLIVADSEPAPAQRTFLVVYFNGSEIRARRVGSAALGASLAITIATGVAIPWGLPDSRGLHASSDGRQFFVSWIAGGRTRATLVNAGTGMPTLAAPLDLGPGVGEIVTSFDGSSFLSFWSTGTEMRGGRVTPAGTPLDGQGFVINALPSTYITTAGSAPFGRSLAAFRVEDMPGVSSAFHGRFVDNELGPGLAGRAPACGAPTGTGGMGGAAGTTGTGGTTGAGGTTGTGGTAGIGGTSGTGGAAGTTATGGATGTGGRGGGTAGAGGAATTGGTTGAGGTAAGTTGGAGATGTAGATSSGGRGGAAQVGSGGAGGSGTAGAKAGDGGGGCGCEISGGDAHLAWAWVALGMLVVARRRTRG